MSTITATNARKSFFELIKRTNQRHEIYHINHKDGGAVLMSEDEYEGLIETLELLSAPGFKEDFEKARKEIERGDTASFDDIFGASQ